MGFNFNKSKFFNFAELHYYNNIIFWKLTSCLNNLKLNILVGLFLIIIFKKYNNQTCNFSKKTILFWVTTVLLLVPDAQSNLYATNFFFKKMNVALLNGVVNVHPWLTFVSYGFLGCMAVVWLSLFFFKKEFVNFVFMRNSAKFTTIFVISLSIFLGGYWAFQELSWGGWWNWDVIELMSLNFFFIVGALAHLQFFQIFKKKLTVTKIFLVIFVASVVVRFNLLSSIHAFINPNLNKVFFIKITLLISVIIIFLKIPLLRNSKKNLKKKNFLFYFYQNIFIIVLYIIYYTATVFLAGEDNVEWSPIIIFLFIWLTIFFFNNFVSLKRNSNSVQIWPLNYIIFLVGTVLVESCAISPHKNNSRAIHINVVIFMLIIFFLKIYAIGFNFLEEIFRGVDLQKMSTFFYGNTFFKKTSALPLVFNVMGFDLFKCAPYSFFNLGGGQMIHFWKNLLFYCGGFLIKLMYLNKNIVVLFYSAWFLILPYIIITFIFKKHVFLKIN